MTTTATEAAAAAKMLIMLGIICLLSGCARKPIWNERHIPTTDTERAAVQQMVENILSATPSTLAGRDQDWDDAISEAHRSATESICRPTYWERLPIAPFAAEYEFTGRWRYAEETTAPRSPLPAPSSSP